MNPERIKNVQSTFFKLVQHNDLAGIRKLISTIRQDSNCVNIVNYFVLEKSGDSSLHICARLGSEYFELFRYLVEEEGANIEQLNIEGKTALHDAAQFSNFEVVQFLLQRGSNPNVIKRADWTPLMLACTKSDVRIIESLLSAGADPNFVNKDGWNCLHLAAREGNCQIVKILMKLDATQNLNSNNTNGTLSQVKSKNGRRPLHTAVMHGHLEVTQLLVEENGTFLPEDVINVTDNCGTTPLMDCCRFGHLELLHYLVELGGNLCQVYNRQGQNCLHIAAEAGQSTVVRELVKIYGMDVNEASRDEAKMMSLHWAAKEGHLETIRVLSEFNANSGLKDGKGRTANDLATTFGHIDAAQLFH